MGSLSIESIGPLQRKLNVPDAGDLIEAIVGIPVVNATREDYQAKLDALFERVATGADLTPVMEDFERKWTELEKVSFQVSDVAMGCELYAWG